MESRAGSTPFRIVGAAWIIAGGLTAAVTGPLSLENGSWAAAFAVLIGGVSQYAIGVVQAALAPRHPTRRTVITELVSWNAGCLVVIGGTVFSAPLIVDAGGLLLVVALAVMVVTVRGRGTGPAWAIWTYRMLLLIILVSIPVGLTLAHLRAG
jgi:hypothetical protein